MQDSSQNMPHRLDSSTLVLEEVRDELMIYDASRKKAFCLNPTAAFVWKNSDGKTTVAEMAKKMEVEMQKPVDEQVIWLALNQFSKDGLLAAASDLPAAAGMTRRAMMRKIGVGAVALPVVTALFISPAKAHASSMKWKDDDGDGNVHDRDRDRDHDHDHDEPHQS